LAQRLRVVYIPPTSTSPDPGAIGTEPDIESNVPFFCAPHRMVANSMQAHKGQGEVGERFVEEVASGPSTELDPRDSDSEHGSDDDSDSDDSSPLGAQDTILIFDWDDTLLPSTWITEQGLSLEPGSVPSDEQQSMLDELAEHSAHTLKVAKRHGKVVVVTNAERGWIEMSCQKFMPSMSSVLEDVSLLSARSAYEQQGIASPFEWKYLAFESEIRSFCKGLDEGVRMNVISFGDSAHEREALIRVTEQLKNCFTKSLKLVERPEVTQLLKEHQLMVGCFRDIVHHRGNLDLCIRCS